MVLPGDVDDRDYQSFTLNAKGEVCRRICGDFDNEFCLNLSQDNIPGKAYVNKFGFAGDVDKDVTPIDIWDGLVLYPWPLTAATTTVVSTDANDTAAGTGARTVEIQGLDSNHDLVTQSVALNGTTDVTLATDLLRVFRAKVLTAGSLGWNAGTIEVSHGATVLAQIDPESNQTLMAIYTIPAGKTGYLFKWYAATSQELGSSNLGLGIVSIYARPDGGVFNLIDRRVVTSSSPVDNHGCGYNVFAAKTDIRIEVTEINVDNMIFNGGFDIILVDD